MAQLNPNFEIDFNDINSYEQIQLINDTQLAKENLLMHKAYKEPAEDEIIRNQFSSFTFVDFCPKLFTINPGASRANSRPASSARMASDQLDSHHHHQHHQDANSSVRPMSSKMLRYQNYELETFSDLFDRINVWLKHNKDWRVVSMETLIFDCTSQFNHLKSSIHSTYLPRNMRGLRLYLSPSKSRFSGPQKIGCINVVPRKLSGQYDDETQPLKYETLDQILARLNDLLLTRPIEGRILSVETLTLPIANGYVNTETNYFMDTRLNSLNQRIYSHANNYQPGSTMFVPSSPLSEQPEAGPATAAAAAPALDGTPPVAAARSQPLPMAHRQHAHGLVDVLRVYYEFGPMVCGLVNLIDFLPHFHRQTRLMTAHDSVAPLESADSETSGDQSKDQLLEIDANETLTRLIRRSLAWFESERKRILHETSVASGVATEIVVDEERPTQLHHKINLKLCNLQIHRKVLLKSHLVALTPQNVFDTIQTGHMFHEPPRDAISCAHCSLSSQTHAIQDWCQHLMNLNEPFELKFVRLAYVVPVDNKQVANRMAALNKPPASIPSHKQAEHQESQAEPLDNLTDDDDKLEPRRNDEVLDYSSPESISKAEAPNDELENEEEEEEEEEELDGEAEATSSSSSSSTSTSSGHDEVDELADDLHVLEGILSTSGELDMEELAKEASLALVHETNRRQQANERAHQLGDEPDEQQEQLSSMIGQLTYRLFAPCQLVNSSSCFSINPVNSSSPLSRRGSVNLNGSSSMHGSTSVSLSSENATPSTLLLPPTTSCSSSNGLASVSESTVSLNQTVPLTPPIHSQQQVISFGAFFPALSHDILVTSAQLSPFGSSSGANGGGGGGGDRSKSSTAGAHFTTNEFESVEAIRRRMEIYVTTNSMKVLAGETLIVNLSDQLSCLSTAIEQTIVRASFVSQRPASSWVSVYVLYAAVDEPHLPGQLLEQQRLREQLSLINEEEEELALGGREPSVGLKSNNDVTENRPRQNGALNGGQDNLVPVFDDDFKPAEQASQQQQQQQQPQQQQQLTSGRSKKNHGLTLKIEPEQTDQMVVASATPLANKTSASNLADGSIRVDLERVSSQSSGPLYNSAYDRTVALPTQPDNHLSDYLEPVDFNLNPSQLADSLWFEEGVGGAGGESMPAGADLSAYCAGSRQHEPITLTSVSVQAAQRQMRLRQGRSAMVGGSGAASRQKKLAAEGKRSSSKSTSKRNKSASKNSTRGEQSQCSLI